MLQEVITEFRGERRQTMATQNRLKKERNTLRKRIFNLEVRVKSDEEKTKAQDVQVKQGFGDDEKPPKNDASKEVDI